MQIMGSVLRVIFFVLMALVMLDTVVNYTSYLWLAVYYCLVLLPALYGVIGLTYIMQPMSLTIVMVGYLVFMNSWGYQNTYTNDVFQTSQFLLVM